MAKNEISGRSAFVSLLKSEGVTHLFGNPGTTELPVMHALGEHPDLTYVMSMHESLVVGMADGFARASGRLGACNVHAAPGLGNAMGSIFNAKYTGVPMIITAGQQELGHGLTEPLLFDNLVRMAEPIVKWAVEVTRLEDLPRIVHRAAKVALTAPPGPVFISLPGDILNKSGGIDLGRRYPARILRDNVAMTFAVLDAAVAHRLDKVVLALSSGMYPVEAPQPNVESQIHDGRPHETAYSYAMAKRLMEPAIRAYRAEHALDVVGAVPSGIYGPDDNYNEDDCTWVAGLVRRFCEWTPAAGDLSIWGDGMPMREITYAPDMARAFMWCLANHSSPGLLNVGCGVAVRIRDVAAQLADICGVPAARVRFDPTRARGIDRRVTDNSAFVARSGFRYTELREGLEATVAWYRRKLAEDPAAIRRRPRIRAE